MRIIVEINGYHEWVPAPPGTAITKEDVEQLRAKQMQDEKWHVRASMKAAEGQHHMVSVHEENVCRLMAAGAKVGKPRSREQVVTHELEQAFRHHLDSKHIEKIIVEDDGPNEPMLRDALAAFEVPTDQHDAIVDEYLDASDLDEYLNVVFKTPASKVGKKVK